MSNIVFAQNIIKEKPWLIRFFSSNLKKARLVLSSLNFFANFAYCINKQNGYQNV